MRYRIRWRIVDSRIRGGLPQSRKRLFICAWLGGRPWPAWPRQVRPAKLKSILDPLPEDPLGRHVQLPTAARARGGVMRTLSDLRSFGLKPALLPICIDCDASRIRWTAGRSPCLTATRGASMGFWLTCAGRNMSLNELFKLQGFSPANIDRAELSDRVLGRMLGNAFNLPVAKLVLAHMIRAARAVPRRISDPWQ